MIFSKMVLFFLNVRNAGIFKRMYGLYGFFSRKLLISSENVRIFVRIFSEKFGHPGSY